ncbi:MAG TPA: FG-GAP-like repeat-containing protein, partial [Opitutaceae bacterium]
QEVAFITSLAKTNWTWSVLLADLDNDGRLDAFFTNGTVREFHNIDVEQRMSASESFAERIRAVKESPPLNEANMAFRNRGDLQFEEVGHAWGLDRVGVSFGAALGDLDGDGDLDLVVANFEAGVSVLRNDSNEGHRVTVALRGVKSNRFGIGSTVEIETVSGKQIHPLVLARGYLSSSEPIIHFGLGNDSVIKRLTVHWPSGIDQVFEDLAVDRRYTITESSEVVTQSNRESAVAPLYKEVGAALNLAATSAETVDTEPRKAELRSFRANHRGPSIATGCLSSAENDDVIIGGTTAAPRRWYQLSGDKAAQLREAPWGGAPVSVDDGPMLIFDVNGDGANDLLVTKNGTAAAADPNSYRAELWLNDGEGHLSLAPEGILPSINSSVSSAAAADFERSGRVGVFLGGNGWPAKYPLAARSFLLANRDGKLVDVTETAAPMLKDIGLVNSALWSDVDGDGAPDLVLAIQWGEVRYLHNDGHGHFEDWTERAGFASAGKGWWTSLASADFNQDGRPDFVAGNVGLNTPYRASPEEPALLYYGAFAPGVGQIALETETEADRVYPRMTRGELAEKIPSILRKFPRNDDYARATIQELFTPERIAKARKYEATEFRSGVFLSQPDGTYRFVPFPRIAQISPFESVVAGDLDGDGFADVYALQNSFAPLPAVGHFDGGLSQLFRGDGHGNFAIVTPKESELLVPDDARGLVELPMGRAGCPGFIATRDDASTL